MKYIVFFILSICQALCVNAAKKDNIAIIIANNLATSRMPEMVELSEKEIRRRLNINDDATDIIITDAEGKEMPSQKTYDGKRIFLSPELKAKEKRIFHARKAQSSDYAPRVFGRRYPERQDDFSFENDRIAYRLYGPETQKKGEKLYGYDLFNKRTTDLILDELYADQTSKSMWSTFNRLNEKNMKREATALYMAFCYHIDHGKGMDCYKVGPTLGAGTNALATPSGISYPWCYTNLELLDRGPLRLTVRLDYGTRLIDGIKVTERRTLTVDAGSNMVKSEVSYTTAEGTRLPSDVKAICGIVVHDENPEAYILDRESGTMAYEDLGDVNVAWDGFRERQAKEMGRIFVGTYIPARDVQMEMLADKKLPGAKGHVISSLSLPEDGRFTYYFGSGWDRNPVTSFRNLDLWAQYLKQFSVQEKSPLSVKIR